MNQLVSEVKRALEEVKRLRDKVDNLKSITSGSNSGVTSSVLLSDLDPLPDDPFTPNPGVGNTASRFDHVHVGGAGSGQYRQFVYTNDNPFEFVVDGDGQPVFALFYLE